MILFTVFPKSAQQKLKEALGFAHKFQDAMLDVIKVADEDIAMSTKKLEGEKKRLEEAELKFRIQETNHNMEVKEIEVAKITAETIVQNIDAIINTCITKVEN